ncbi:MAG: sulfotransferase [Magnetococcales bacterium]|nr:sulfotransferase [Magnetococcales bacterium]
MTPHSLEDVMQQAAQHQAQGESANAEKLYNQILAQHPLYHPAYSAWALLALESDRAPLALALFAQAVALDPEQPIYQRNYGEICRRQGRLNEAIKAGRVATTLLPHDLDAHYNLGLALADNQQHEEAKKYYRRALEIDPQHGFSWNNLGAVLEKEGDTEEALKAYQKAVDINPQHAEAQNNRGVLFSETGNLKKAREAFNQAIAVHPYFIEAHNNLSTIKTYTLDDPHYTHLETLAPTVHQLPLNARIRFAFSLGKALEDTKQYQRAFDAYAEGNRLQNGLFSSNETAANQHLDQTRSLFSKESIDQWREQIKGEHDPERVPVFIVGMPRSGSTLIEQIISTHPALHGAGEIHTLDALVKGHTPPNSPAFPLWLTGDSPQNWQNIGKAYCDQLWQDHPNKRYISDKMLANFHYIGLIHLVMPHAKIIHSMRDPMDSCFSCFSRHFKNTMEFTYDLGNLGRYYQRYMAYMDHWHQVLPPGTLLDVHYEEVVADFEPQARRVLEYVGLPWNPKVLQFHRNKRLVKTASIVQVRKPIYTDSVARWERFGKNNLLPLYQLVKQYR